MLSYSNRLFVVIQFESRSVLKAHGYSFSIETTVRDSFWKCPCVTERLHEKWNVAKQENPAHKLTEVLWALTVLLFIILTHWAQQWLLLQSEAWCLIKTCHQTVWARSYDSFWTRLDRWSRWGMNSCRRGLADRTWSVTRLLWRDRYTLSCLQDNKYTQCYTINS